MGGISPGGRHRPPTPGTLRAPVGRPCRPGWPPRGTGGALIRAHALCLGGQITLIDPGKARNRMRIKNRVETACDRPLRPISPIKRDRGETPLRCASPQVRPLEMTARTQSPEEAASGLISGLAVPGRWSGLHALPRKGCLDWGNGAKRPRTNQSSGPPSGRDALAASARMFCGESGALDRRRRPEAGLAARTSGFFPSAKRWESAPGSKRCIARGERGGEQVRRTRASRARQICLTMGLAWSTIDGSNRNVETSEGSAHVKPESRTRTTRRSVKPERTAPRLPARRAKEAEGPSNGTEAEAPKSEASNSQETDDKKKVN